VASPPVRGLLLALSAFLLGLLLGPWGPDASLRLLLAAILFLILVLFHLSPSLSTPKTLLLLLLWLTLGWVRGTPLPAPNLPEGTAWIEGTVRVPLEEYPEWRRVRLTDIRWSLPNRAADLEGGAVVALSGDLGRGVHPGERLRLAAQIAAFPGPRNPGGFDASSYWAMRGVRYRISHVESLERGAGVGWTAQIERTLGRMRAEMRGIVSREAWPGTEPLAEALILGDRSGWDTSQRDQLARSGLMHLFEFDRRGFATLQGLGKILIQRERLRYSYGAECQDTEKQDTHGQSQ